MGYDRSLLLRVCDMVSEELVKNRDNPIFEVVKRLPVCD
jgi:hypothetical protein